MTLKINIKKLNDNAIIPTRGSEYAAGYDLYAGCADKDALMETNVIKPYGTMKIHTGLAMEIPKGYFGAIFARSGMATKRGLRPTNCVGVIDSDYHGEIIVVLRNDSDSEQIISSGERIAQIVIMPYIPVEFKEVNSLGDTKRDDGGFGSTGLN